MYEEEMKEIEDRGEVYGLNTNTCDARIESTINWY